MLYTVLLSFFLKKIVQLTEFRHLWEKILSLTEKNRERETGKCLICIKIFIFDSRAKSIICVFRNWWEQETRCVVSSPPSLISVFIYMDRAPTCLCPFHSAIYCPCTGTDFMPASVCMSQCQVLTFRAAPPKTKPFNLCHILSKNLSFSVDIPRCTYFKRA